jgi:hypothetical protein
MTRKVYEKRMKQHEATFDRLWQKMVKDTNQFIKDNPDNTMYSLRNLDRFTDSLALSGAWIVDRINGKYPRDRGSLTKKIRRALGFSIP